MHIGGMFIVGFNFLFLNLYNQVNCRKIGGAAAGLGGSLLHVLIYL